MSSYAIKEIFLTLQGEGKQAGRAAVFCRFSGCNLWSGRERDRANAICTFCDTDFVGTNGSGGGRYLAPTDLADAVLNEWGAGYSHRLCVLTGGEPLLQVDEALVDELHARGFAVAVETNGTVHPPQGLDWICVSPKGGTDIRIAAGNELKLVFPQQGVQPAEYEHLAFEHFLLQPMDGPQLAQNTAAAIAYCMANPKWTLSMQSHKHLGIR